MPEVTESHGPTVAGTNPSEWFDVGTGSGWTANLPGCVVTLIHGRFELYVVPLNSSCHEVPAVKFSSWNVTSPRRAPT